MREAGRKASQPKPILRLLRRAIRPILEQDSQWIRRLDGDGSAALAEVLLDFRVSAGVLAYIEKCRRGRLHYASRMGFCDTLGGRGIRERAKEKQRSIDHKRHR